MSEQFDKHCEDCGRLKARNAPDIMSGACPKWYAIRDPEAAADCDGVKAGRQAFGDFGKKLAPSSTAAMKAGYFVTQWLWDARPYGGDRKTSQMPWTWEYTSDAAAMCEAFARLSLVPSATTFAQMHLHEIERDRLVLKLLDEVDAMRRGSGTTYPEGQDPLAELRHLTPKTAQLDVAEQFARKASAKENR